MKKKLNFKPVLALVLSLVCVFSLVHSESVAAPIEKTDVRILFETYSYVDYMDYLFDQINADEDCPYNFIVDRVPFDELDEKINLAHASGDDYDIIQVNNSSVRQFKNAGVLESLDAFVAEHPDITENYGASTLGVGQVNGVQYAIPVSPDARVLAYNKHILEDYGFSEPTTQAEILEICKTVSKDGIYGFARQMDTPLAPAYIEGLFWMANGTSIAKEIDGNLVATCNEEAMIKSIEWWQEMTPYMPDDINMTASQIRALFDQGKLAFYVFGPWDFASLENFVYGEDYELILPPGDVTYGVTSGGFYLGIGANAANKEGALAFLEKFIAPENICYCTDGLPADGRCYGNGAFTDAKYNIFMSAMQYAAVPFPITASFNEINDVFFAYFNQCLFDNSDVAPLMEKCNAEIQALLDADSQ